MDEFMGEIREFKRATLEKLSRIEQKVEDLQHFKIRVLGMASVIAILASAALQVLSKVF